MGTDIRDSKGISELPLIQLILKGTISCIRGSLEIPYHPWTDISTLNTGQLYNSAPAWNCLPLDKTLESADL